MKPSLLKIVFLTLIATQVTNVLAQQVLTQEYLNSLSINELKELYQVALKKDPNFDPRNPEASKIEHVMMQKRLNANNQGSYPFKSGADFSSETEEYKQAEEIEASAQKIADEMKSIPSAEQASPSEKAAAEALLKDLEVKKAEVKAEETKKEEVRPEAKKEEVKAGPIKLDMSEAVKVIVQEEAAKRAQAQKQEQEEKEKAAQIDEQKIKQKAAEIVQDIKQVPSPEQADPAEKAAAQELLKPASEDKKEDIEAKAEQIVKQQDQKADEVEPAKAEGKVRLSASEFINAQSLNFNWNEITGKSKAGMDIDQDNKYKLMTELTKSSDDQQNHQRFAQVSKDKNGNIEEVTEFEARRKELGIGKSEKQMKLNHYVLDDAGKITSYIQCDGTEKETGCEIFTKEKCDRHEKFFGEGSSFGQELQNQCVDLFSKMDDVFNHNSELEDKKFQDLNEKTQKSMKRALKFELKRPRFDRDNVLNNIARISKMKAICEKVDFQSLEGEAETHNMFTKKSVAAQK